MSDSPIVSACANCDYRAYPPRLLCPRCGGEEWEGVPARAGVVTDVTELNTKFGRRRLPSGAWIEPGTEPPRIAAVEADAGARLIVRLMDDAGVGARVRLVAEQGRVIAYEAEPETKAG